MPVGSGARPDYPGEAARRACLTGVDALTAVKTYLDDPGGKDAGKDFAELKQSVDGALQSLGEARASIPSQWDAAVPVEVLSAIEDGITVLSSVQIHTFITDTKSNIVSSALDMRASLSRAREAPD